MTLSKPMRLDQVLVDQATLTARRQKRTVPRQIEYWAELGRMVGRVLDADTLIAVQEGLLRLQLETVPSTPISADEVLGDIRSARRAGTLASRVSTAPVRYQTNKEHPGLLEEVAADGTRRLGRFADGKFVPFDA